jgi:hypothetical protein
MLHQDGLMSLGSLCLFLRVVQVSLSLLGEHLVLILFVLFLRLNLFDLPLSMLFQLICQWYKQVPFPNIELGL